MLCNNSLCSFVISVLCVAIETVTGSVEAISKENYYSVR